MDIKEIRIVITLTVTVLLLSACGGYAAEVPNEEDTEGVPIDVETAAKLAMVVSYHAQYGQSLRFNLKKYGSSPRTLVDSFEICSLDGRDKYYAITLYRGEDEPKSPEEIDTRVGRWADAMFSLAEESDDGAYTLRQPTAEMIQDPVFMFFFDTLDEFTDYYSCTVPASAPPGFLSNFHQGISRYSHFEALARLVLAADLGVEPDEVIVERITPEYLYLYKTADGEYIVDMSRFFFEKYIEIVRGDAVAEAIENGGLAAAGETVEDPVEAAAKEEDIFKWLALVEKVEKKYGFDPGPGITADSVNPVLMGNYVRTLYQEGASLHVIFDSRHPPE